MIAGERVTQDSRATCPTIMNGIVTYYNYIKLLVNSLVNKLLTCYS